MKYTIQVFDEKYGKFVTKTTTDGAEAMRIFNSYGNKPHRFSFRSFTAREV